MKNLIKNIFAFPFRIFSKISPFAYISNSVISKKTGVCMGTRIHNSIISDYTYVGKNCLITNTRIGRFVSIADRCMINLGHHPINMVSTSPIFYTDKNIFKEGFSKFDIGLQEEVVIGNDVWIGANVFIKEGVVIGDGSIVGAFSVVTKDVEPYSIVVGNPARVIRMRFDKQTISRLLKSKWWSDIDKVKLFAKYSNDVNKFLEEIE